MNLQKWEEKNIKENLPIQELIFRFLLLLKKSNPSCWTRALIIWVLTHFDLSKLLQLSEALVQGELFSTLILHSLPILYFSFITKSFILSFWWDLYKFDFQSQRNNISIRAKYDLPKLDKIYIYHELLIILSLIILHKKFIV